MSTTQSANTLKELVIGQENAILEDWMSEMTAALSLRPDLMSERELRQQSTDFLRLLVRAVSAGETSDVEGSHYGAVRDLLTNISRTRAAQGFTPGETAMFVFSLKQPLFSVLQREFAHDPKGFAEAMWQVTIALDKLGLYTAETFMRSREEIIKRQQTELLELSTPVVKIWDGVVAVPLIGTLDSARTQIVMESLLQRIVETGASMAIIDITGVPTVDTLVAQHLIKTIAAARLMGAECIISGVRAQIAQTIVHLGISLADVTTKATLADAIAVAFRQIGLTVTRVK